MKTKKMQIKFQALSEVEKKATMGGVRDICSNLTCNEQKFKLKSNASGRDAKS